MGILTLYKVNFRTWNIISDKEGPFLLIKHLLHPEVTGISNTTTSQLNLIDTYRLFHSITAPHAFPHIPNGTFVRAF